MWSRSTRHRYWLAVYSLGEKCPAERKRVTHDRSGSETERREGEQPIVKRCSNVIQGEFGFFRCGYSVRHPDATTAIQRRSAIYTPSPIRPLEPTATNH